MVDQLDEKEENRRESSKEHWTGARESYVWGMLRKGDLWAM